MFQASLLYVRLDKRQLVNELLHLFVTARTLRMFLQVRNHPIKFVFHYLKLTVFCRCHANNFALNYLKRFSEREHDLLHARSLINVVEKILNDPECVLFYKLLVHK